MKLLSMLFTRGRQSATDISFEYFTWTALPRTVQAVDPRCFFIHKRLWEDAGGFDPAMGHAAPMDLSLRLRQKGLATLISPMAEFVPALNADTPWENDGRIAHPAFVQQWQGRIAPCNPNLTRSPTGWALSWGEGFSAGQA